MTQEEMEEEIASVNAEVRKQRIAILDALQILMDRAVDSPALEIAPERVSIKVTDPAVQAWIKGVLMKHGRIKDTL